MAYMCMGCGEIYDWNTEICPKAGCEGDVVWIDELMIPIIKILRKKGYITSYCCSGHIYSNICNAYVVFEDFMSDVLDDNEIDYIKEHLPKSWVLNINNGITISFQHMIHACCDEGYELEKWEDIVVANMELLKFVKELPELEY